MPLTKIINLSLNTGKFHDGWKSAIVRPLIKSFPKGTIKTNYRPVRNLSFISKIVEKCTLEQCIQHCNNYELLPSYQSAYRKFHGSETSLVKLVNDLLWAMENQQVTSVVILDLSAAFNTIDHELLFQVLHHRFQISGSTLKWYTTYLRPRRFRVCINGCYLSETNAFQCTPRINTGCLSVHCLCIHHYQSDTKLTST